MHLHNGCLEGLFILRAVSPDVAVAGLSPGEILRTEAREQAASAASALAPITSPQPASSDTNYLHSIVNCNEYHYSMENQLVYIKT